MMSPVKCQAGETVFEMEAGMKITPIGLEWMQG